MNKQYDIAILGGGPGGYVAAIRAGQLGFKAVVIDKDNLGGICLNWGCIPTKSLLKNAEIYDTVKNHGKDFGITAKELTFDFKKIIQRSRGISDRISKSVEILIKKNKVERIRGFGKFKSKNELSIFDENGKQIDSITAENIIIATGAQPKDIPSIPIDNKMIITSTEAMNLSEQPREMIIIGAGAIGIEFAYFYSVLGTKVTIIEMMENILPVEDKEVSQTLARTFKKRKIDILTGTMVEKAVVKGKKVEVIVTVKGEKKKLTSDIV
jgi:dihydrolipoamide dehydrogenase